MNRQWQGLALALSLLASTAWAHGVVDQSNVWNTTNAGTCSPEGGSLYQSFRPAASTLIGVDLFLRDYVPGADLVTLRIRSGGPTGAVLATAKAELTGEVAHFDLAPALNVLPGSTLTIEWLDKPGNDLAWKHIDKNTYPYGIAFGCTGAPAPWEDRLFRTYSAGGASRSAEHGTVDQDNTTGGGTFTSCGGDGSLYQSFTPSASPLGAVELNLVRGTPDDLTAEVRIRQGSPAGAVLATASASVPASGPTHFDLASAVAVQPETLYVLEWLSGPGLFWSRNSTNTYSRGQAFGCTGSPQPSLDFRFRTFVLPGGGPGGSATDPSGQGPPDLVAASAVVIGQDLELSVDLFAPTFDNAATVVQVAIDVDRNPSTGLVDSLLGELGADVIVAWGPDFCVPQGDSVNALVVRYDAGGVVTGFDLVPTLFGPASYRVRVPLDFLGSPDGPMHARVVASPCQQPGGILTSTDALPDVQLPPLTTADLEPPAGPWLSSEELDGFRVKARVLTSPPRAGKLVNDCIGETLCIAGALANRAEVLVRVPGPKPNGYLWPTLVKFNTAPVEVWIEQTDTGALRYYLLRGSAPGVDELPGLIDRTGFLP